MKVKVSELEGAALDWAVAKCEGRKEPEVVNNFAVAWYTWGNTHYSTDWAQGGPIIEREKIGGYYNTGNECWDQATSNGRIVESGETKLIAAMRCFVASKLGEEVDVPDELGEQT